MPAGRIVAPVPEPLELQGESVDGGHMKLSWAGPKSPRWHHYNIYCSDTAGFTPDRKTLIASPDRSEHLDWQGRGKRYYRVTQVTLDGLESKPSNEIER